MTKLMIKIKISKFLKEIMLRIIVISNLVNVDFVALQIIK